MQIAMRFANENEKPITYQCNDAPKLIKSHLQIREEWERNGEIAFTTNNDTNSEHLK
mgnify:CR=1 FL=1